MNTQYNWKIKITDLFFYLGLIFFGFEKIVYEGSYIRFLLPDIVEQVLKYSALFMFMSSIMIKKRKAKYFFFECLFFLTMIIISIGVRNTYLILLVMMLFASQGILFDKIISFNLKLNIFFIFFVLVFCLIGVIPDMQFMHGNEIAHSMGFFYYSNLSYLVFFSFVSLLYLKQNKKKKYGHMCFYLIINFLIYRLTTVRLTFYFSIVFVILLKIIEKAKLKNKGWLLLANVIFPTMSILSVIISFLYITNNTFIQKMNFLLLNRIRFSYWALINNGLSLFGKHIETSDATVIDGVVDYSTYFFVDCGYIFTLVEYGVITFGILIGMYTFITRYSVKTENNFLFIWAITLSVMSLINNMLTNVLINPLVFLIPSAIDYSRIMRKKKVRYSEKY